MKTFVVALDGSSRAAGVLASAAALAESLDASIVLVRATDVPGDLPVEALASDPDAVTSILVDRGRDDLAGLADQARVRPRAIRVEVGPAWKVIERVAREEDADLVVVGAHGYGPMERFLGTVAAKVVNRADRPVLVVRRPERIP
jgi:nucleotide-binding universal stress UspA family protein